MHIRDLKQILWWLSGGLLICTLVLVVVIFMNPSTSFKSRFSKFAGDQVVQARKVDQEHHAASAGFDSMYGATHELKIDGIAPPPPVKRDKTEEKKTEEIRPLSDYIEVVSLWTDMAFYKKKGSSPLEEIQEGGDVPFKHAPIKPPARLLRIDYRTTPFRVVFQVRDNEEIFLIPREAVWLGHREEKVTSLGGKPYPGPDGLVDPQSRGPIVQGVSRGKDDSIQLGEDVQDLIRTDPDRFFKDVAWKSTRHGIAIQKIVKGSRVAILNQQAGGTILKEGDVVVSVNGVKVQSKSQIVNYFKQNPVKSGGLVRVEILRLGKPITQSFRVPQAR